MSSIISISLIYGDVESWPQVSSIPIEREFDDFKIVLSTCELYKLDPDEIIALNHIRAAANILEHAKWDKPTYGINVPIKYSTFRLVNIILSVYHRYDFRWSKTILLLLRTSLWPSHQTYFEWMLDNYVTWDKCRRSFTFNAHVLQAFRREYPMKMPLVRAVMRPRCIIVTKNQ